MAIMLVYTDRQCGREGYAQLQCLPLSQCSRSRNTLAKPESSANTAMPIPRDQVVPVRAASIAAGKWK
jgi:hypothetical protein